MTPADHVIALGLVVLRLQVELPVAHAGRAAT